MSQYRYLLSFLVVAALGAFSATGCFIVDDSGSGDDEDGGAGEGNGGSAGSASGGSSNGGTSNGGTSSGGTSSGGTGGSAPLCEPATGDDACTLCLRGSCCDELTTCVESPDCEDYVLCVTECVDTACIETCDGLYPAGSLLFYDVADCGDALCAVECA